MTSRRNFIQILPVACAALGLSGAWAAEAAKVDPADPQAKALGYTPDATTVDKAKYPKFAADQACGGCQLFSGKPTDAYAGCALFAGKQVAAKGWCSAYTKRA
jgi:hypothetical protein